MNDERQLKLDRPLVFLDTETTGTNPAIDRIITLATVKVTPDNAGEVREYSFNPGMPIPPEATECHGITNEDVKDKPSFRSVAKLIHAELVGCDLGGFCITDFDIPILWEEFWRAGIQWDLSGIRLLDAGTIYKMKEARTLESAVLFYLKRKHDDAHSAKADAIAVRDVFFEQRVFYEDLHEKGIDGMAEFCRTDNRVDLAGKIVAGERGPEYAIGKAKGTRVIDDKGFGDWMLRNDFPEQTKQVLRKILYPNQRP